mgnify:FL=1
MQSRLINCVPSYLGQTLVISTCFLLLYTFFLRFSIGITAGHVKVLLCRTKKIRESNGSVEPHGPAHKEKRSFI